MPMKSSLELKPIKLQSTSKLQLPESSKSTSPLRVTQSRLEPISTRLILMPRAHLHPLQLQQQNQLQKLLPLRKHQRRLNRPLLNQALLLLQAHLQARNHRQVEALCSQLQLSKLQTQSTEQELRLEWQ